MIVIYPDSLEKSACCELKIWRYSKVRSLSYVFVKQKDPSPITTVIASPQGRGNLLVLRSKFVPCAGRSPRAKRPRDDMVVEIGSFFTVPYNIERVLSVRDTLDVF